MRKWIGIAVWAVLIGVVSCEADDFCEKNTLTPRLVVRFYDANRPSRLKNVTKVWVIGEGKNTALYSGETTDSIVLPLKINEKETIYSIWSNASLNEQGRLSGDEVRLKLSYNPQEIFVSKACGYEVNFYQLKAKIEPDSGWVKSVKIKSDEVLHENKAHLFIYH